MIAKRRGLIPCRRPFHGLQINNERGLIKPAGEVDPSPFHHRLRTNTLRHGIFVACNAAMMTLKSSVTRLRTARGDGAEDGVGSTNH